MTRRKWKRLSVCDEEPVLFIDSPMCRAFSTSIELTQARKSSEVSRKNLVDRCVKHLKFCFRMYETQRNAGRLFLHEHPWDAWSRDLSFVKEMAEMDGMHETKVYLCRFQWQRRVSRKDLCLCQIQNVSMRCYNKDGQAKGHMKNFVIAVLKGLKREMNSVKTIVSMEVGITSEEPNVLELCEYAEELKKYV